MALDLQASNDATITDEPEISGIHIVRLTSPTPIAAQLSLWAFGRSKIGGALLTTELSILPSILAATGDHVGAVSTNICTLAQRIPALTSRQLDIMHQMACGASNDEIADKECISISTLKRDIRRLRNMMGCRTRTELAQRFALPASQQ